MSNSVSLLDLIQTSQTQKEITANALFDAASNCMLYGRRASTTSGLTWGYYGGALYVAGAPVQIPNGTLTLTANATNYVQVSLAGVISVNAVGFTLGSITLYTIVVGATTVTSYTDQRAINFTGGPAGPQGIQGIDGPAGPEGGTSPLAFKGDLLVRGELFATRLGLGTVGHVLTSAPSNPLGVVWAAPGVGAQPFDLTAFYPGKPTTNAWITRVPVARAIAFPSALAGSVAVAETAATAITDLRLYKNNVLLGVNIRFGVGSMNGEFTGTVISLVAGDILSIQAPVTPDATLATIGIVLAGTR